MDIPKLPLTGGPLLVPNLPRKNLTRRLSKKCVTDATGRRVRPREQQKDWGVGGMTGVLEGDPLGMS